MSESDLISQLLKLAEQLGGLVKRFRRGGLSRRQINRSMHRVSQIGMVINQIEKILN